MSWNVATPADNSQVRSGDDYIRELKQDLELAISEEHSFPVDGGDPHGYHNIPAGTTAERPVGATGQWYYNTTTSTIQRYSGSAWEDLTDSVFLPAGTVMVFCQTTAPTGWTRLASINDSMLRAVTGATGGSTGGAWGITIVAANHAHDHGGVTAAQTLSAAHSGGVSTSAYAPSGAATPIVQFGSLSHTSNGSHTHTISSNAFNHGHTVLSTWKPKYKDVIIAEKD